METLTKTPYPDDKEFWDGDKLFPYLGDCDIAISFSVRNIGKTYANFKNLRKAIEKGYNVAISRYDRIELAVSIADFLSYYQSRNEDGELEYNYKRINPPIKEMPIQIYEFENGARAYFFAIKDSPNLKGMEIKNLKRWFCDEIVPIAYKFQTRKWKEFDYFIELYHTVLRCNTGLKVLMSANCKNWLNPYCMGWDIPKFKTGNILKIVRSVNIDGEEYELRMAVENVEPSKAMAKRFIRGEVVMGRSMDDIKRELSNYSSDPDSFIETCNNAIDTSTQIKVKGKIYGLYYKNNKNYIREEKLNLAKDRYLLTQIEYDENFVYEPMFVRTLEKLVNLNRVKFDKRTTEHSIRLGIWLSHTKTV